jgi:hypothetical protein
MEPREIERIVRAALRELGAGHAGVTVTPEGRADRWRIEVAAAPPRSFVVRAGRGTRAEFIRDQIFEHFQQQ